MSYKVVRLLRPSGVDLLADKLLDDDDFENGALVEMLKGLLETVKEQTLFLLVWRDDQLVAFILTVAPLNQRHTFVIQAWSDGTVPKRLLDRVFERVKRWTEMLGRETVRMETLRDPEAWHRRWGFKQRSVIMELNVCDEEIEDGQFEQDKADDHPELSTAAGQRTDEPAADDSAGGPSDLQGSNDGAAVAGPAEGRGAPGELSAGTV